MKLELSPTFRNLVKISLFVLSLMLTNKATAEQGMIDDFKNKPETRWKFIADTVMGGVSTGQLTFSIDGDEKFARMTGKVSTENNGGFIQFRRYILNGLPASAKGLQLSVRGNGQTYFVHIRTKGTFLPWQYYHHSFTVGPNWSQVKTLIKEFRPSGLLLRKTIKPASITSIAIVAFGRDHDAEIDVKAISFF